MSVVWRIIDTGSLDPFANMAFDEAILRGYRSHSSPPTLRIYGWSEPGLSFGYSQDPQNDLDIDRCRMEAMPFVRRITGGGIILHGKELTYSLVCSKEDLGLPASIVSSYKIICSFLISFYNALGIKTQFACDAQADETLGRASAICFAAKEKYDIVQNGRKIGGSAQKRSKSIIFQHGSIPFNFNKGRASSFLRAKEIKGGEGGATCLDDILGENMIEQEAPKLLRKAFINSFDVKAEDRGFSDEEKEIFTNLKTLKYESADWNYNRVDRTL